MQEDAGASNRSAGARSLAAGSARETLFSSLRARVAALLALSLLPIGAVMVAQTSQLESEVENRLELSLLALTTQVGAEEREIIQRAVGRSLTISSFVAELANDTGLCRAYLENFQRTDAEISFVGLIPRDGMMTCLTGPETLDLSQNQGIMTLMEAPQLQIGFIETAAISGESVINVLAPAYDAGAFVGFVTLSVPYRKTVPEFVPQIADDILNFATFNGDGELLTTLREDRSLINLLPVGSSLSDFTSGRQQVLHAQSADGRALTYAATPIIPGLVYGLSVWPSKTTATSIAGHVIPPILLPLLMMLASILVAYFAIDRLVVHPVTQLRRDMRRFADRRALPDTAINRATTQELRELETAFRVMAEDLIADEARMENDLREKNILLKEIHHRVKNNLQLISSIMSMQIRQARGAETAAVLGRLQDRVLGLAAVHAKLYRAEHVDKTNAGALIVDLFRQLVKVAEDAGNRIDLQCDHEDIMLLPDQALPLSLLASELATNAVKNARPAGPGQPASISLTIRADGPDHVLLVCANSIGPDFADAAEDGGLGQKLIRAFAMQLGGTTKTDDTNGRYTVSLRFKVEQTAVDPADY